LGCYEAAIASYDKALEFKPASNAAWYKRGLALSELKRYEEAIAGYNQALELNTDDAILGTTVGLRCGKWDGMKRRSLVMIKLWNSK
jgi:superkiller protein 3